jgi:DNA-directed RNA polymerase, subunit E''''
VLGFHVVDLLTVEDEGAEFCRNVGSHDFTEEWIPLALVCKPQHSNLNMCFSLT